MPKVLASQANNQYVDVFQNSDLRHLNSVICTLRMNNEKEHLLLNAMGSKNTFSGTKAIFKPNSCRNSLKGTVPFGVPEELNTFNQHHQ